MAASEEDLAAVEGPSRERRAATAFVLIAVFNLILLVLYGSIIGRLPFERTVLAGGAILQIGVLLVASYGLATRRTWATSVVTPMLVLVIAAGILSLGIALAQASLDIPYGVVLAGWALVAPSTRPAGRLAPGGVLLVAALVVAIVWPYATWWLSGTSGR